MLANGAALFLGFGFSFLPNFTPFLAILIFFTERRALERRDLLWLGAAVLLALPLALAGDLAPALRDFAQLVGAWLLFLAFGMLRRAAEPRLDPLLLGIGLLVGLATTVVAAALTQIESVQTTANLSQVLVWRGSPALFGHTALTLGVLIAAIVPKGVLRTAALLLSAAGILLSGSREAAIAWLLVVVVLQLFVPLRTLRGRAVEAGLLVGVLLLTVGVGSQYGFARLGFLLDLAPARQSSNLLHGTELPNGDWWFARGVEVEAGTAELNGSPVTAYRVTKTEPEAWRRLQQVAQLQPGTTYTASAWFGPWSPGAQPGMQGWGETVGGGRFIMSSGLPDTGWGATASGDGTILGAGVEEEGVGWRRAWVTFRYEGEEPLTWWVGLTPDQRERSGTWAEFAGFQLEASEALGSYVPGSATQGLDMAAARAPYWRAAVEAFLERPLAGWGALPFPSYYLEHGGSLGRFYEVPDHTHSLPLQVLFERGLVGLAGLLLLAAALASRALRSRDIPFIAALVAIALANLFDYSLFHAGVMYPLAAVAGWRAAASHDADRSRSSAIRQAAVRGVLAATDLLVVALSLAVAAAIRVLLGEDSVWLGQLQMLPAATLYVMMLWPAAAWREGLYPGYGLTPPQELGKQVQASVFAGLLLAVGSFLLPIEELAPRSLLLWTVLFALLLAPVGRAAAKRVLLALGVWGRPVVILGAGPTGRRVVRALQRSPLDGLQPVALFDDDGRLTGRAIEGIRILGPLSDAGRFAVSHAVDHAIVAIPSLAAGTTAGLIDREGRAFRHMQFIPQLSGLPAEEVYASSIDGMLALEIRNGLYLRRNRVVKRAIDVAGTLLGGLLLLPLIAVIYLLVRLDSRGAGFFRSQRIGENGRAFGCLKFRTMYSDAEERLAEIMAGDPGIREEYTRFHKLERDPRITPVGRFLRRFSLDELPQLFNVLRGEMSLVGPRPYMVTELPDMGRYSETILRAKPGLTGYWQVNGRNNVTFRERLEMESHYVRNWSIWWDIIVLVNTGAAVVRRDGAA